MKKNPDRAVQNERRIDPGLQQPEGEHHAGKSERQHAEVVEYAPAGQLRAQGQHRDQRTEQDRDCRADHRQKQAVDDGAMRDRIVEQHITVMLERELVEPYVGRPHRADRAQDQSADRKHDRQNDVAHAHRADDPAPARKRDALRARALAADCRIGAFAERAPLQPEAAERDDKQRDAERGAEAVARRIADLGLDDAGRQDADPRGRAENRRHAELLGRKREHEKGAAENGGQRERQRDGEGRPEEARAGRQGRLFQCRIHRPQGAGDHQEDERHLIERLDEDDAGQRIDVHQRTGRTDRHPELVEEARRGIGQHHPGQRAEERRRDERHDRRHLDQPPSRHVGTHHRPCEERARHGRDERGSRSDHDRVEDGPVVAWISYRPARTSAAKTIRRYRSPTPRQYARPDTGSSGIKAR